MPIFSSRNHPEFRFRGRERTLVARDHIIK